jgi:hypothetical protein
MTAPVKVVDHPLIKHKLSLVRSRSTAPDSFRRLVREISYLLAYELTRDLPLEPVTIDTPVASTVVPMLSGKPPCIVSVLRAGNGLLDGFLDVMPSAAVGHIGLVRDPARMRRRANKICLLTRRSRGHRSFASGLSRGRDPHGVHRREIGRSRLHRSRTGRCRRSPVRDDVAARNRRDVRSARRISHRVSVIVDEAFTKPAPAFPRKRRLHRAL